MLTVKEVKGILTEKNVEITEDLVHTIMINSPQTKKQVLDVLDSYVTNLVNVAEEAMIEVDSDICRYFHIQDSVEGGYDYTYYDEEGEEIDGGVCDNDGTLMGKVAREILADECEEFRFIRILDEDEAEEIFEGEYQRMFDEM